jgi:L-asparaginase
MKMLFVQTGGTIDKDYPKKIKGYAFEITDPAVNRILPKVNPNFEYEVVSVAKKDSTELTSLDRQEILKVCQRVDVDKIVITHGTDTLIETAQTLDKLKGKTVVLMGAVHPERFKDTDADFNLGFAIAVAQMAKPGIYIAMNGRAIDCKKCSRDKNTGQFVEDK